MVGIARLASYDRQKIRQQVESLFDSLGGLKDIVPSGARVAIKINLTGGTEVPPMRGVTPMESYITHPDVVRTVAELVKDAGAGKVYVVEAVKTWKDFTEWGYGVLEKDLGLTLVDINQPGPYKSFTTFPVGDQAQIFDSFELNPLLGEIDTFISVAKMKCHWWCGVTQSMKNLIGLGSTPKYSLKPEDGIRTAFHGVESETPRHLPRVILDLNHARPIHLSIIDGIKTVEGGEGPWQMVRPVKPGVLLAGKNPLATDTVATAVMGFDPQADYPNPPFVRGDNHLNLAAKLGFGTNRLADIDVLGAQVSEVVTKFEPSGK